MDEIKFYKKIEVTNPSMIAAWPGMGNVALGTADYIRKNLKAVRFAEIKMDPLATLDAVEVEDGISKFPKPPLNTFYYVKNPDRSEEHTSELQSQFHLVCRLLLV